MPMLRRLGGTRDTSAPPMRMRPSEGVSNPAIIRSVVVLPQPEPPRKETNSPFSTFSVNPRTTVLRPKLLTTS